MIPDKKTFTRVWVVVPLLLLLLLNYAGSIYHRRIDLTNERRFTLSSHTRTLLKSLDDVVRIDVFLKGELPSGFRQLESSTDDLLQEFKEYGGSNIQYRFIAATDQAEESDRTYADTLASMGINPINLKIQVKTGEQSQYVFPVALIHYKDKTVPVVLYPGSKVLITPEELNSAEALMEYHFMDVIEKIIQLNLPMVGYCVGNGEPTDVRVQDLVENVLRKNYNLKMLNISEQPVIPDTFKLLMIVKPTQAFSDDEKIKLDQYVMRGGKIIWSIDKLQAEMDSLQIKNQVIAYDRNLNIEDILFKYGTRINSDLLMDLQCDFLPFVVNGKDQFELRLWNYFPIFESRSNHIINKNLGLVSGRFVNSIDTVKSDDIVKTILLNSSSNSRTISTPALISPEEVRQQPDGVLFVKKDIPAAVLLEGKFKSLYANRISQSKLDTLDRYGYPFQSSCITATKMIVIGDGDIFLNSVSRQSPIPMGMNPYTYGSQKEYPFANRQFLINSIEYLISNSGLNEAAGKEYTLRLLDTKKIQEEKLKWQIINIGIPVLIVLIFALIYQLWRKKRYIK